MICLSIRTVLICCVLVVTLTTVAGRELDTKTIHNKTNGEFVPDISSRIDIKREQLLPADCGIENPVDRIYGGAMTELDEHPWMALVIANSDSNFTQYVCGGALISNRYVLTNAWCTYKGQWVPHLVLSHVILGAWNLTAWKDCPGGHAGNCDPPHQEIQIKKAIYHEMYNNTDRRHDIGLLRLDSEAEFTEYVKPICLPLTNELKQSVKIGEQLVFVGWGQTGGSHAADVKHKISLPVVSNRNCNSRYTSDELDNKRQITTTQLCAGGFEGRGFCFGDGGGPLMGRRGPNGSKWVVFGIASYTLLPCAQKDWPNVFTRVGPYTEWILRNMEP